MGIIILIRKLKEKFGFHYYQVYKQDSLDEIDYCIGLDSQSNRILFFKDDLFELPFSIFDIDLNKFTLENSILQPLINGRVILRGMQAIKKNEFPQSISWES